MSQLSRSRRRSPTVAAAAAAAATAASGGAPWADFWRPLQDWLTQLPWSTFKPEILDPKAAKEVLDRDHYGLEDVKERILEFIAVGSERHQSFRCLSSWFRCLSLSFLLPLLVVPLPVLVFPLPLLGFHCHCSCVRCLCSCFHCLCSCLHGRSNSLPFACIFTAAQSL